MPWQTKCDDIEWQVVDDNFVNRIVASKMLQRYGVKVVTVESGQQAIDRLQAAPHAIDMVFMDVHMPGMDGSVSSFLQLNVASAVLPDM